MMRETSLDEHAAVDMSEKSLTIGSVSLSHHRQTTNRLQRDIGSNDNNNNNHHNRHGIYNRNQVEGRDEEEKKQEEEEETAATRIPRLVEAGKKKQKYSMKDVNTKQQQMLQMPNTPQQTPPPQDYLRHMATAAAQKRAGTSWWERVVVQRSSYVVEDLVENYTADSEFLQSDPLPVAWLDRIEVETGDMLGAGTYSNVYRVQGLDLLPDFLTDHPEQDQLRRELGVRFQLPKKEESAEESTGNPRATSTTSTNGYAIKHLKAELLQNSKLFEAAAADLIMEAKFLSRLSHPNILRLRGMALGGSSTFSTTGLFDSYFLVVDELEETMIQRIHRWKIQGTTDQYQPTMILYKLKMAVQVASALAYLHERRLVFRDLKPHNIGLERDGTIQLFDFGFCRELPSPSNSIPRGSRIRKGGGEDTSNLPPETPSTSTEEEEEEEEDKLYCMSGKGTLLYMSSEVLSSRCYNAKADVYSWSMVTYELLTLQKPFAVGSIEQHKKAVCERAQRPPLHHLRWLSPGVKELLQHSWRADVQARWHMRDVKDALDDIISELENTRQTFSREASFGYSNTGAFFCQGVEMDSIILDITNTVQTRYEYIANQIFCRGSPKDVAPTNATTKREPSVRDPKPEVSVTFVKPEASVSLAMHQPEPSPKKEKKLALTAVAAAVAAAEAIDKLSSENSLACQNDKKVAPAASGIGAERSSEEEKQDNFLATVGSFSISTSFWGSPSPRIPDTSEQFPMTSLCMHSVRMSAARNRQVTSGLISHSMNDVRPNMMNGLNGSRSPPRRASMSTLRQSADYGSGRVRQRRASMSNVGQRRVAMSTLGQTSEQGAIFMTNEGPGMNNGSCALQTIRSEEDDKSTDEISLVEGEELQLEEDNKHHLPELASPQLGVNDAGSEYHSANEDSPRKVSNEEEERASSSQQQETEADHRSQYLEKKKRGNPQDDQASQSESGQGSHSESGHLIPATASV